MDDECANCGLSAPVYDDDGRCPLCQTDQSRQNGAQQNPVAGRVATILNSSDPPQLTLKAAEAILEHGSARAAGKALDCNHGVILMALDGKETDAAYKALGVRKTNRHRLCFEFDTEAELTRVRAVVDSHPGGRTEWLKEQTEVDDDVVQCRG